VDDCLLVAPENMDGGGCSGVEMMAGWQAVGVVHLLMGTSGAGTESPRSLES
jgi:hypothetical protein